MSVDYKKGYFDAVTDAHGIVGMRNDLPIEDRQFALRAYINYRLLFWREMYFTDAAINNNTNLRFLMFEDKAIQNNKYPLLPRDYNKLLSNNIFKIAVRDSLTPGSHAKELYKLQKRNKYTDIPNESYVEAIDGMVQEKLKTSQTIIMPFCTKKVSLLFSNKVKIYLQHQTINDLELNFVKLMLWSHYKDYELINFNGLLTNLVLKGYNLNSRVYKIIKSDISMYYNSNVPETLGLNYETSIKSLTPGESFGRHLPTMERCEVENRIPFVNAFNADLLAYIPSDIIIQSLNLSQRYKFIKKLNDTITGDNKDIDILSAAFESYVKQLDLLFKDSFSNLSWNILASIKTEENKNIFIKLHESQVS